MDTSPEPGQVIAAPEEVSEKVSTQTTGKRRLYLKYLLAILIAICVYLPFTFFTRPVRVGDGSEYYAMAVAWSDTHRSYMTESGWAYYDLLYTSNAIPGISGTDALRNYTPELTVNGTQDFNHFWFYSLGAAVIAEMGDYSGILIPIHTAFLLWHWLLFTFMLLVAIHYYGWKGLVAVLVLTFLSPVFWYLDKVHTEFFTFCVTTIAVIYFMRKKYFASALFLAFAATQNISFSLVSVFVLGIGIFHHRKDKWKLGEIALFLAIILVNTLHPAYYFIRYGTPDPQFLSGGAHAGLNLSHFWIWLLDPDVGLLPNWWFGLVVLLIALGIAIQRKFKFEGLSPWLLFCGVYLVISLVAQSSTINLNSGASPGLARYGIWYIALFFPAVSLLFTGYPKSCWAEGVTIAFAVLAAVYSVQNFLPTMGGTAHCQPSAVSYWLQKNLPGLYNPPPEIFTERYGGVCENIQWVSNTAIIGPDCRKLYFSNFQADEAMTVTGGSGCQLDFVKVSSLIGEKFSHSTWSTNNSYHWLTPNEVNAIRFLPQWDEWYAFAFGNSLTQAIGAEYRHWGLLEDWGFWSVGRKTEISLPCPPGDSTNPVNKLELDFQPFVTDTHPQVTASISLNKAPSWSGTLNSREVITLSVPASACQQVDKVTMRIIIDNPVSRAGLGISGDMRKLGVGLIRMRYLP